MEIFFLIIGLLFGYTFKSLLIKEVIVLTNHVIFYLETIES